MINVLDQIAAIEPPAKRIKLRDTTGNTERLLERFEKAEAIYMSLQAELADSRCQTEQWKAMADIYEKGIQYPEDNAKKTQTQCQEFEKKGKADRFTQAPSNLETSLVRNPMGPDTSVTQLATCQPIPRNGPKKWTKPI